MTSLWKPLELQDRWEYVPEGGLMLKEVVPEDEGWFTCSPTNGFGEAPTATAFLTVQYPAYVVEMPDQIFVTRGLDTILTCDVDAKPLVEYIVWFKDGVEIAITRVPRYNQEDDGSLVITSAELQDSGTFTCTPYNSLGTAGSSTGTNLIVRDPPVFVRRPKGLYQQMKGKDITIPCSASGDPTPQITWKKIGGEIAQYRSTATRTSLTIRSLVKSDHGIYECRATNEIATIVTSTQLIVESTSPHAPYNVTVVTHITSVHISWQPAYNGGFSQTYTIKYRPRDRGRDESGWTSMGNIPEEVTQMLLYNLEASTTYEFAVIATNQLGDSMASDVKLATTRDPYDFVSPPPTDETGRTLFPPYLGMIPSPPYNVTLSITKQGLVLTWGAPVQFSNLVEHYAVEYRIDGPWLVLDDQIDAKQRKLLLSGLQPNTTYQFRVFAFTPAAFSDPSEVITENTGDISMFAPKPTGAEFGAPPGIIAGIIAGLCFLLLALVLSIIAICLSHRRRKKKRLVFFNVTSQTPQKLIHSPTPNKKNSSRVRSGLAKFKLLKLGSKQNKHNKSQHPSARHGLYHVNNNSNHNSPNGKIPNGGMDKKLSDRLLSQLPGHAASYRVDIDLSDSSAHMSRGGTEPRFASEEALGIEDLGMTNVMMHDPDYQIPDDTYAYAYRNNTTSDANHADDTQSETSCPMQDDSKSPLRPQDTDSAGHWGLCILPR
ncbi:protein turtle homolog B-like isoform X2 [Amphiura filiformis]|uniref:protein turtle homolog B-like isoform X2 n=1 Tax=Amphiura filiformis TaxID=82378 RepID=UPI003B210F91